jgi:hypothetical protein
MPLVVDQINDMISAGVPLEKITEFKENKILEMQQADIPIEKITEAFGSKKYDRTDIQNYWKSISEEVKKEVNPADKVDFSQIKSIDDIPKEVNAADRIEKYLFGTDERYQFKPYMKKALGNAGLNKIIKYHSGGGLGYEVDAPVPDGTGFLEKLTEGAVGLVAELPTFIPGALVGGFTGAGGGMFGGGFSAGAVQGIYTEALQRGEVKNFPEWWDIFMEEGLSEGAKTGAQLYAAYVVPGLPFIKPFTNNIIGSTLIQSTAYTAAGVAMGDELPTLEDFAITNLLFAPFNINASKKKIDNIVAKTGKKPIDIIDNAIKDRTIIEDINSKNIEIPRAYRDIVPEKVTLETIKRDADIAFEKMDKDLLTIKENLKTQEKITELKNKNKEIYKTEREKNKKDGNTLSPFFKKTFKEERKKNPNITFTEVTRVVEKKLSDRTNKKLEENLLKIKKLELKLDKASKDQIDKVDKPLDEVRNKLDESIAKDPPPKKIFEMKNFVDDLFYNLLDKNHVFKRAEIKARKLGIEYETKVGPYENFQLLNGVRGTIEAFIEKGALDFKTGNIIGPSLRSVFTKYKINTEAIYKDFKRYAIAKRAIEKSSQGFQTGVDIKAAKQFVKENSKFEEPFREIVKVSEFSLKYLLDAGVISKEVYQAALKANKDFVPFFRDFLEESGQGNFSTTVRNPLKYFKGSKRKIIDPFESIYNNIYTFITIAKRNEANVSFIEMIEKGRKKDKNFFPEVQLSEKRTKETKITPKELESIVDNPASLKSSVADGFSVFRKESGILKDTEIVVYRNGKREVWEVGETFARPTKVFDKGTFEIVANFLSLPSKTLRLGATGAAEFMYNNIPRDAFGGSIQSKGWYPPFTQTVVGLSMAIKPLRKVFGLESVHEKYLKSEALQNSIITLDRTYFNKTVKSHLTKTNPINLIKNLPEYFRVYIEFSEKINRMGVYKLALDRNLKKGLDNTQALKKAAVETRDNPIDYKRMGHSINGLNQLSAFFNARIQGLNQTAKAFKERPAQTLAKNFMYITAPSVALWFANHNDPDYQSLPQWRKDLFWNIRINGTYYPIAKPFELGLIFGTGAERFLDYFYDKDPKALEKFGDATLVQLFKGVVPVPDFLKPFWEAENNRSFFFDRPIIPMGLEGIPSEYQFTDFTSETTKLIAGLIRKINGDDFSKWSSPLVLENAWRGWSGGVGGYILALSDSLLDAAGVIDRSKNRKKMLSEYPVIKAIFIKNPDRNAEPITDFRTLFKPVNARIKAANLLQQKGEIEKAKKERAKLPEGWVTLEVAYRAMAVQEDFIRNINEGTKNPEEKLFLTNMVLKDMINGAKEAINMYYKKEVYIIKKEMD